MKERLNLAALTGTMEELPRNEMNEVRGGIAPILIPIVYIILHLAAEGGQAACHCASIFCGLGLWVA
jgi:hypothetical protein